MLVAAAAMFASGCVQMMAQQRDVADFVDDASATTATVLYCGSTKKYHYFCFRHATGLPDSFARVPVQEVSLKGPRKFTRKRSRWVVLSDQALARLIREAAKEPVTFPTVY